MSGTGDGDARNGAAPNDSEQSEGSADADQNAVERVLDALAPLTEQMDHADGFAVKHAQKREAGHHVPDPLTVEVRFYYPDRHPQEADMAQGMLQGHGYQPERKYTGRAGKTCTYLSVPVTEDGEPREPEESDPSASGGDQGTL